MDTWRGTALTFWTKQHQIAGGEGSAQRFDLLELREAMLLSANRDASTGPWKDACPAPPTSPRNTHKLNECSLGVGHCSEVFCALTHLIFAMTL